MLLLRNTYNIGVKIHFTSLVLAFLNFIAKKNLLISLNYTFAYNLTLFIYISAIILFFSTSKSSKKLRRYFLLYLISPLVGLILFLFGGLLFTILIAIFFSPLFPMQVVSEFHPVTIYHKPQGLMGSCCPYLLTEKTYGIFEKEIGEIDFYNNLDIRHIVKHSSANNYAVKITYNQYNYQTKHNILVDTIVVFKGRDY